MTRMVVRSEEDGADCRGRRATGKNWTQDACAEHAADVMVWKCPWLRFDFVVRGASERTITHTREQQSRTAEREPDRHTERSAEASNVARETKKTQSRTHKQRPVAVWVDCQRRARRTDGGVSARLPSEPHEPVQTSARGDSATTVGREYVRLARRNPRQRRFKREKLRLRDVQSGCACCSVSAWNSLQKS